MTDKKFTVANNPFFVGIEDFINDLRASEALSKFGDNYPPHNLIKQNDTTYTIEMAVAGFKREDIELSVEKSTLIVKGKSQKVGSYGTYIHKGIGLRDFEKSFRLNTDVEVDGAELKDGLLVITLKRIIPEKDKPKTIEIR